MMMVILKKYKIVESKSMTPIERKSLLLGLGYGLSSSSNLHEMYHPDEREISYNSNNSDRKKTQLLVPKLCHYQSAQRTRFIRS